MTIKAIQTINVKEIGEEIAQELINEHNDIDIDDVTKNITIFLHNGIKSDIIHYALLYLQKQGYEI